MRRARTLALVVLLLSYGALGARQPAVRTSAALGVSATQLAATLGIPDPDRSHILLDVVRIVFDSPDGQDAGDSGLRQRLHDLYRGSPVAGRDTVPLPLDPSIWRDTILKRQVPDAELISAILSSRPTALLYHGLAALDDETLAALGPDREILEVLLRHAGVFATFGRGLRIHAGRVVVPGGPEADPLWQELVGVEPTRPSGFIRRLFDSDTGRLAFFFDALSHLDLAHQRFAIGRHLPEASRLERVRALLDVFDRTAPEWRPDDRPFMRPPFDPAITLSLVRVTPDGAPVAPFLRRLWTRIFRGDETLELPLAAATAADAAAADDPSPVDAAWIASRVHRSPAAIGRRRLDTLLFAQRTLSDVIDDDAGVVSALRGTLAFPTLSLTLERMGLASTAVLTRAALRAESLNAIHEAEARRTAIVLLQSTLGLLDRIAQNKGLAPAELGGLVDGLIGIEAVPESYGTRIAAWLLGDLAASLPPAADAPDSLEDSLLRAMAGPVAGPSSGAAPKVVTWEGRAYRVDPTGAEHRRLLLVRQRQGGATLDEAVEGLRERSGAPSSGRSPRDARLRADRTLADTLTSILYAAYLGEPDGPALSGASVALRHDLALAGAAPARPSGAWRMPEEEFRTRNGWRVAGSLLGLDSALARLALRRLDSGAMPLESRLSATDRRTAALTAALLNPYRMTDAARDEIAAALGRGRARLAALDGGNREEVERVALAAGLSEWRREALAWTLIQDPPKAASALSLLELLWLGAPRASAAAPLDPWGAATQPLTGCSCLELPRVRAWEDLSGRPAQGIMATRAADVSLRAAEVLSARRLPASLAPGIVALAMQDALDAARPAYFDDWSGFTGAVSALSPQKMDDYIAALTAGGPLMPVARTDLPSSRR